MAGSHPAGRNARRHGGSDVAAAQRERPDKGAGQHDVTRDVTADVIRRGTHHSAARVRGRREAGVERRHDGAEIGHRRHEAVLLPGNIGSSCVVTVRSHSSATVALRYDTIRYEMLFNVRSKADISRLNLPHGNDN